IVISGHRTPVAGSISQLASTYDTELKCEPVGSPKILLGNPFHTSSVIIRKDLPLRFSSEFKRGEDYLLWCEVILRQYSAVTLQPPLAFVFKPLFGYGGLSMNLAAMQA